MKLDAEEHGPNLIVRVGEDRIDAKVAVRFKDALRELTLSGHPTVVLDLGQVEFLDSSGLGALVAAMKQIGPDRRLDLAAVTPKVERVFRLTRMDTVFRLFPDTDTACQASADAT